MVTATMLTLEHFLAQPETKPAQEFACGEVEPKPMPTLSHAELQTFLVVVLAQFLRTADLGRVYIELRCTFGPRGHRRSYVPDLSFVAWSCHPDGDLRTLGHLSVAPNLAIEILSPGQPAERFARKLRFYLNHGVEMVWVVDPAVETITVYLPGDADEHVLRAGDVLDGGTVLPGFQVAVSDVMARLQAARPY